MERQLKLELFNFFQSRDEIPLVILFGSYSQCRQTETSDVDVAVYVEQSFSADEKLILQAETQDLKKTSI